MRRGARAAIVVGAGLVGGAYTDHLMQGRAQELEAQPAIIAECQSGQRPVVRTEQGLECAGIKVYEQLGVVAAGQPVEVDWYRTERAVQSEIEDLTLQRVLADLAGLGLFGAVGALGVSISNAKQNEGSRVGVVRG